MHLNEFMKTTLKNVVPVVYSDVILKVGDSGKILMFRVADMLIDLILGNRCSKTSATTR